MCCCSGVIADFIKCSTKQKIVEIDDHNYKAVPSVTLAIITYCYQDNTCIRALRELFYLCISIVD